MLMTVAEKTKLGGVTSFDKWPGYEQQYGSKRPKQVRNMGFKKKWYCSQKEANKCLAQIIPEAFTGEEKRISRSGIASSSLRRRKGWEKCRHVSSEYENRESRVVQGGVMTPGRGRLWSHIQV